jgi:alpha-amylase/alpha-mannosidase (GH57 family)
MKRYVCIHGHFYQPPRENPWLEEVELQDSARPYHDWNERVTAECYARNSASRIVDGENRIIDLINNYSKISFNVGPTLCAWMERHKPEVLEAIVAADKMSRERFDGHGSALAQIYNHMIMPLANARDKYTQVYWGIIDFRRRFGRFPEGIWLPETAVDIATLEVLAQLKVKFTILSPHQAESFKTTRKGERWHHAQGSIETKMPYSCTLPSGKSIGLFFYDSAISHDIAFGRLLDNGEQFANRLIGAFDPDETAPQIVHVATDGESYGHHRRYGEMALSYCLHTIDSRNSATLTNYGQFLAQHPPSHLVKIVENSSWSCIHGIERWRDNCGCNAGRAGWTQAWRKPLRDALDEVRDILVPLFEKEASRYLHNPWNARNDYIDVMHDRSRENVNKYLAHHARSELLHEDKVRVLQLMEMQRNSMLMYTSCGWFFDEISGIETTQVLQYAARAVQLAEALFTTPLESRLLERLARAPSNVMHDGAEVYRQYAKPASIDLLRVGAHYGIYSLFAERKGRTQLYCYTVDQEAYRKSVTGKFKLASGRVMVTSNLTWEQDRVSFAVVHFGDHNISGGVRPFMTEEAFSSMQVEILREFEKSHITQVLQLMLKYFGSNTYSVWHLFKDQQREVVKNLLAGSLENIDRDLRMIYEENFAVMNYLHNLRHPIPGALREIAAYVINAELLSLLDRQDLDLERLQQLVDQAKKWSCTLRTSELQFSASSWVDRQVETLKTKPTDLQHLDLINRSLHAMEGLQLELDIWKAQNAYFATGRSVYAEWKQRAAQDDQVAQRWLELFGALGKYLRVKIE